MKLVTYSDTQLLIGDEAADLLIRYASSLANMGRSDVVVVKALGVLGATVEVTFLLDSGTLMLAKQAETDQREPENSTVVAYMHDRMLALEQPLRVRPSNADFGDVSRSLLD